MSTGIEWTDATWNPVTGCSKVSPGCAHCYAETLAMTRLVGKPGYSGLPWTPENAAQNVVLRPDRLALPLGWRKPRRVFVNSMSDLFHEFVPDAFIERVFAVMALAPRHTFQVLTKRPERMRALLSNPGFHVNVLHARWRVLLGADYRPEDVQAWQQAHPDHPASTTQPWPLPNVWLGTSVENQHWADVRIPELVATPAAVRFLSCEPLLGPLDLRLEHEVLTDLMDLDPERSERYRGQYPFFGKGLPVDAITRRRHWLHWIIGGGESGPAHRPMGPDWIRSLRDQCLRANVPFFFKQWGGARSGGKAELDGQEWREYPTVAA